MSSADHGQRTTPNLSKRRPPLTVNRCRFLLPLACRDDPCLLQLPHLGKRSLPRLRKKGISVLPQLMELPARRLRSTLQSCCQIHGSHLEQVRAGRMNGRGNTPPSFKALCSQRRDAAMPSALHVQRRAPNLSKNPFGHTMPTAHLQ